MNVNDVVGKLELNGHRINRGPDGRPITWVDPDGRIPLVINGKVMSQREAERLLPWTDRFSN
jgi:hypothetical protein